MKSNKLIVFGACLFLFFTSFASVTYGVKIDQEIALETIQTGFNAANTDETTVEITVNLEDFNFNSKNTEQGLFTSINLPDFSYSYIQGLPKLPVIRKTIEIPFDSDLQISINTISWEETNLDDLSMPNRIIPAQHSVEKIPEPIDDFIINEEFYNANMFYPQNIAEVVDTGIVRGRCFAQIEISPVQYNPANGDLKLMNACEITIDLQNADMTRTYDELQKYSTPSYENLFSKMFENYGFYEQELLGGRDDEGFLAIVYDDFYDELQPLTNLKESKGYDVTVTKTSDIPGGPSKENIFDYIQEAYDDWSIPPAYILLVGDTPQIPTFDGETYGPSAADLYFVTVDGSDWIPDIHIGRFSGSSEAHIQAMVEKTVLYENADFDDTEWIKKAAFIASSDHGQLAEETHNHVIDTYLDSAGYSCDKIYEASGGNTQDIYDSLNDGRSLCIYSGHGYSGGWGCVPFSSNDIYNLENEDMYPFVCSHACSTNVFDQSECYGEAWLRAEDKGAIGFWGASASTYWDEDDILERAMFQAWWEDGLSSMGDMTDMGLWYLYEYYSGGSNTKYYFEAYNLIGDPSLNLWSDDPNSPPETPEIPDGPEDGTEHQELTFSAVTTDPEGEMIYFMFDWGNDEYSSWMGPVNSGESVYGVYSWEIAGTYDVKVKAKDINNRESSWSPSLTVVVHENTAPEKPVVNAPNMGTTGKSLKIEVSSTDSEGHDILYYIAWGDGAIDLWEGPYPSGETVEFSHAYSEPDTYNIVVKPKDQYEASGQQAQVSVRIVKSRAIEFNPLIYKILRQIFTNVIYLINIL